LCGRRPLHVRPVLLAWDVVVGNLVPAILWLKWSVFCRVLIVVWLCWSAFSATLFCVRILCRCCVILSSLKLLIKWWLWLIKPESALVLIVVSIKSIRLTLPLTALLYLLGTPSRKKSLKSTMGPTLRIAKEPDILVIASSRIVLLMLLVHLLTLLRISRCAVTYRRLTCCWMVSGNVVPWLILVPLLPCWVLDCCVWWVAWKILCMLLALVSLVLVKSNWSFLVFFIICLCSLRIYWRL